MLAPYERLAELADEAERLAAEARYGDLSRVWEERDRIVATLPPRAPQGARPLLERALRAVRATEAIVRDELEGSRRALGSLSVGRRAAEGYGGRYTAILLDATA